MNSRRYSSVHVIIYYIRSAVLKPVGRGPAWCDQGWELRNFLGVSHVSQSMKRYQVLVAEARASAT